MIELKEKVSNIWCTLDNDVQQYIENLENRNIKDFKLIIEIKRQLTKYKETKDPNIIDMLNSDLSNRIFFG